MRKQRDLTAMLRHPPEAPWATLGALVPQRDGVTPLCEHVQCDD